MKHGTLISVNWKSSKKLIFKKFFIVKDGKILLIHRLLLSDGKSCS